jgi:hypothetical protein
MFDIITLRRLNNEAAKRSARAETETSRHCSYSGDTESGVVLHSAKQRSTVFLAPAKAKAFLAAWFGTNSAESHDRLVESYFAS